MVCKNCNFRVHSDMRHAFVTNSCPSCGKGIFTQQELQDRNSVHKILVRNGVESDETIENAVNDIMAYFSGNPIPAVRQAVVQAPVQQAPVQEVPIAISEIDMAGLSHAEQSKLKAKELRDQRIAGTAPMVMPDETDDPNSPMYEPPLSDEEERAPSRILDPQGPRASAVADTSNPTGDAVANAMRAFEDNEKPVPFGRTPDPLEQADADTDLEGIFLMENPKHSALEKSKQAARNARRQGLTGPKAFERRG